MPRIARMIIKGESAVYYVMFHTALDGCVIGDVEKEVLFKLIKRLSSIYFAEVIGFCLMGNHFHLLVRVHPGEEYSDEEIKKRCTAHGVRLTVKQKAEKSRDRKPRLQRAVIGTPLSVKKVQRDDKMNTQHRTLNEGRKVRSSVTGSR